jgi:hypothetical protein
VKNQHTVKQHADGDITYITHSLGNYWKEHIGFSERDFVSYELRTFNHGSTKDTQKYYIKKCSG